MNADSCKCVFGWFVCVLFLSAPIPVGSCYASPAFHAVARQDEAQAKEIALSLADALFERHMWADALEVYRNLEGQSLEEHYHIMNRVVVCSIALKRWDDATKDALKYKNVIETWVAEGRDLSFWRKMPRQKKIGQLEAVVRLILSIYEVGSSGKPSEHQDQIA